MKTEYTILRPNGTQQTYSIDWPEEPDYLTIKALVEPIVGEPMEHVSVLRNGERADMFVDEYGHMRKEKQEFNKAATKIYDFAPIVGTAVIFRRIVWT